MRRWIARVAALYPRSWRAEYGEEFGALLDDVKPGWRVFANVLGGAIKMQMTTGANWLKLVAATAVFGAIVAAGASFTVATRYVSSAAISVTPQPDPVRPASPQAFRQRATAQIMQMEQEVLSRTSLSETIQKLDLYKRERRRIPLEDVIEQMRKDVRFEARSSTPMVFSISFAYPDRIRAQAAVRELAAKFTKSNGTFNRTLEMAYRSFWHDEASVAAFQHAKPLLVPPPPTGNIVAVLDPASLPKSVSPNRTAFLAWGLGAGLLLGLLAALAMRWPRGVLQLCGFAVAGCVLAGAASFLIPNRYTSTAVMEIAPAVLTEDPLATPPSATPAAEFLRQMEPQVLSPPSLSRIILEIDLYPGERARKPMEEVVRNMLARDIRIAVLNPASGANGALSAFGISFSYSDRVKARDVVQRLLTTFNEERLFRDRANASQMSDKLREINQRKAGENLSVLDPSSLPMSPESPNRLTIAVAGLGAGLLLGAIILGLRRPRTPALQRRAGPGGPARTGGSAPQLRRIPTVEKM